MGGRKPDLRGCASHVDIFSIVSRENITEARTCVSQSVDAKVKTDSSFLALWHNGWSTISCVCVCVRA